MIYIINVTKNRFIIKKKLRYYIINYRHSLVIWPKQVAEVF